MQQVNLATFFNQVNDFKLLKILNTLKTWIEALFNLWACY